tara:strand:- start:55 stop:432 length:378 start_codon:yes stop_codon:yes gene_type:complete
MTKAYKIDARACTVTEVEVDGINDMHKEIGCTTFTISNSVDRTVPDIFVDDEGLWTEEPLFFICAGHMQPLCGNGLAMDVDEEGESIKPRMSIEKFRERVQFVSIIKVNGTPRIFPRTPELESGQ